MDTIKREIEREHPDIAAAGTGHFPHYPEYKSRLFKSLTKCERDFYEELAREWDDKGPPQDIKNANAKNHLAHFLKGVIFELSRDYGVYGAFIKAGTPGSDEKPEIIDYFKDLNLAKERLSDYINWDPVLVRFEEFTKKSYTAYLAQTETAPPAAAIPREAIKLTKKLKGSLKSGISLKFDDENKRVLLPTELYLSNTDFFMKREESFYGECLRAAFQLALNKSDKVKVPWKALGANPAAFLPPELIPEDVIFDRPSHTKASHREASIDLWLRTGYIYVHTARVPRPAAPAAGHRPPAAEDALIIPNIVINRYGCCGQEVLLTQGLQLYEPGNEATSNNVVEDELLDPAELQRCEDREYSHLAPRSVPTTSEARAQYCLTALQLVKEGRERAVAVRCAQAMVKLATNPRDDTCREQIEDLDPQLLPPDVISWDAVTPLIGDGDIMAVRQWLSRRPYERDGFLGWEQGWLYMLAMVMFLVSESSQTVNAHQLKKNKDWAIIMDTIPEDAGTWDSVSGRDALTDDFERFYESPEPAFADVPIGKERTFGSWEWGRCGLPSEMHTGEDTEGWDDLKSAWSSASALFETPGVLHSREVGLMLLLQMALAYCDFSNMLDLPEEHQPTTMRNSILDAEQGKDAIESAVNMYLDALREEFTFRDIPPRPTAIRRVFNVRPDLRADLVRTIMTLREGDHARSLLEEGIYRAHQREATFAQRIRENRAAREKVRKAREVAGHRGAEQPAAHGMPNAAGRKRKDKVVPIVPSLPLTVKAFPARAARSPTPPPVSAALSAARGRRRARDSLAGPAKPQRRVKAAKRKASASRSSRKRRRTNSVVRFADEDEDDLYAEDTSEKETDVGEENFQSELDDVDSDAPSARPVVSRPQPKPRPVGRRRSQTQVTGSETNWAARAAGPGSRPVTPTRDTSPHTPRTPLTPRRMQVFVQLTPRSSLSSHG
ncbi:unnamed protein product [Peniophora sp. CBMAI 1063]|nr:unnamed protein product [Peniophora sp. CBMAI 1063]